MIDGIYDDGKLIGFAKITRDLTERREIELQLEQSREQLAQAQKMEAIGQLTGGLAHDFNNLLTGITGSLELLKSRIAQGRVGDAERYVGVAQGAAERAAALTHRLLAFARRQPLDPRPVVANQLVAGLQDMVQRTVGPEIRVEVALEPALWTVLCDPNQLENAILNLCINARDAMPNGGRLTIQTANSSLDQDNARAQDMEPGQYVTVSVIDTGTGMPPEVIAHAFDPFFTTKPMGQGTGLGLSMVYGFVRQSDGQVCISSEMGVGTSVHIYLPRYQGASATQEVPAPAVQPPRVASGETVLIVDDEPTVRMLVSEVLEELGYSAIEAAEGAAGLKILESGIRIDLLITDIGLPGGISGRQMADAARRTHPDLKILFITGYAENAAMNKVHLGPGMHIMAKPFAVERLASRIKAILAGD